MTSYNWLYLIVTVVLAIVPECGLFLWWGASISVRLKQLEADKDRLYKEMDGVSSLSTRIALLEQSMKNIETTLTEIRDELRKK